MEVLRLAAKDVSERIGHAVDESSREYLQHIAVVMDAAAEVVAIRDAEIERLRSPAREAVGDETSARERLQAIIDWADLALSQPSEFNKHGVLNPDGPVFDAAREYLASASPLPQAAAEPASGKSREVEVGEGSFLTSS